MHLKLVIEVCDLLWGLNKILVLSLNYSISFLVIENTISTIIILPVNEFIVNNIIWPINEFIVNNIILPINEFIVNNIILTINEFMVMESLKFFFKHSKANPFSCNCFPQIANLSLSVALTMLALLLLFSKWCLSSALRSYIRSARTLRVTTPRPNSGQITRTLRRRKRNLMSRAGKCKPRYVMTWLTHFCTWGQAKSCSANERFNGFLLFNFCREPTIWIIIKKKCFTVKKKIGCGEKEGISVLSYYVLSWPMLQNESTLHHCIYVQFFLAIYW